MGNLRGILNQLDHDTIQLLQETEMVQELGYYIPPQLDIHVMHRALSRL